MPIMANKSQNKGINTISKGYKEMDREQAREYIVNNPTQYLQLARDKKTYICPICGSGTGKKGTGISTKDKRHFTCWAGCFTNADIIDIIGLENHIEDAAEKFKKAYEVYGIDIDAPKERAVISNEKATRTETPNTETTPKRDNNTMADIEEMKIDFSNFYDDARGHIQEPAALEYLKSRGISIELAEKFYLGYVKNWQHPKMSNSPATPRIIIPISKYSYLARDIRASVPAEQEQYKKSKAKGVDSPIWFFNHKALKRANKPIIIVEGEFDALSILEAGGEAISIGSLSNIDKFIEFAKINKPTQPILIALDNDPAGQDKVSKLQQGLYDLGIETYIIDICHDAKDPNEALTSDREAFIEVIKGANRLEPAIISKEEYEAYNNSTSLQDLDSLFSAIETSKDKEYISTGLNSLDTQLDEGLRSGLYVVGAISSLGKTTFCLQLVSYMAKQGNDVLIFSLEMAKNELIAKSISRETMIADIRKTQSYSNAKSTLAILDGKRHKKYSKIEQEVYADAIRQYKEYAGNIHIFEGVGNISIDTVKDAVTRHIYLTGNKPIVLIDYMQIMAHPSSVKHSMTDKQITDYNIVKLKQLSRDYDIPIIGVSSFNRESYTEPVNMSAFKESGAVEYTADVLIGLQYEGMDYKKTGDKWEKDNEHTSRVKELLEMQTEKAKNLQPQQIECKILKNRNGLKGTVQLDFYPMFNRFTERNKITGNDTVDSNGFNIVIDEEIVFEQEDLEVI